MSSRRAHVILWLALILPVQAGSDSTASSSATGSSAEAGEPGKPRVPDSARATPLTKAGPDAKATPARSEQTAPSSPKPLPRPRLSAQVIAQITGDIPPWKPQPKPAPPPPPDPDVVQMKPVIVQGQRLPRIDRTEWLTPRGRELLLSKEYLSSLDRDFLNRYTLPIVGVSKEARARMMYEEDKRLRDMKWMSDQIDLAKKTDPAAARELQQISNDTFTRPLGP